MKTELSVLIVHYHAEEYLKPLIDSMWLFLESHAVEVLIWDNGSANGQPENLGFGDAFQWHCSPRNLGFAQGHRSLAEKAQGDWFLILNPDAAFTAGGMERLWQTAQELPLAGVVAPRIGYPDGRIQPTVFPPYAFGFDLRKSFWLEHNLSSFPSLKKLWAKLEQTKEPFSVGWASGACLLVRREVWDKTGGFDPQFFFGGEDADFCRRVWEVGFEVVCEPRALLLHQGGQSLQREFENRIFYYYQKRMYFARKHFNRLQYTILYLVSFFELVFKWLAGLILGILKPEWRAKRRGFAKTMAVFASSQLGQPGEWMTHWTKGKATRAGIAL